MKIRIFNQYVVKVTNLFGIDTDELFDKTKKRKVVDARHLLYYLCYTRPMRLRYIQDYMSGNGYDVGHSSILHGIAQVERKIVEDGDYSNIISDILLETQDMF